MYNQQHRAHNCPVACLVLTSYSFSSPMTTSVVSIMHISKIFLNMLEFAGVAQVLVDVIVTKDLTFVLWPTRVRMVELAT